MLRLDQYRTVLSFTIPHECFEAVAWQRGKIAERRSSFHPIQLEPSEHLKSREGLDRFPAEKSLVQRPSVINANPSIAGSSGAPSQRRHMCPCCTSGATGSCWHRERANRKSGRT
jgi:hypothetical protein